MQTKLTKSERDYIVAMYQEDSPEIKGITDISQLPLCWVALFMENRELAVKKVWPNDHSISEKYLSYHQLPLNMSFKDWDKWAHKQPNHKLDYTSWNSRVKK
jgi:hypothetical protein